MLSCRTSSLASAVFAEDIDGHMADIEDDDIDYMYVNDSGDSSARQSQRGLVYSGRQNSQEMYSNEENQTQCCSDTEADRHRAGNCR